MRIAVFSDIHGNPYATRTVLDAISERCSFDAVVLAGDICAGGSDPAACVDMVRAGDIQAVYGNADEFIFAPQEEPPSERFRPRWDLIRRRTGWTAEKLGAERVNWLRSLPFELRFSPTQNSKDDLLVLHSNPKDVYTFIFPPEEIQTSVLGRIEQPENDPALMDLFDQVEAGVIACGHFHYTSERFVNDVHLVNVSPCSFSAFTPDRRARFTIFEWIGKWQIERVFIEYDYQQEGRALLNSDMPDCEEMANYFA
jgi:predicted phosphodiesterase